MVKYSFLVPVYNVEHYLGKCINSLLEQNYPVEEYEIVLVDDGSTDSSGEICDRFAVNYSFIKTIHQDNRGLMQARRAGVQASEGEYLIFIDSDDYVGEELLRVIDNNIEAHHPDFLMYGYYRVENGLSKIVYMTEEPCKVYSQEEMLLLLAGSDCYNAISGKVVRADIMKSHIDEIYAYSFNIGEDKVQTAFLTKYSNKIVFIRDHPYYYIIRNDSIIHDKKMEDLYETIEMYGVVRKVISDVIDGNSSLHEKRDRILTQYDTMTADSVMDHIYKYNHRKDIDISVKTQNLGGLLSEHHDFFSKEKLNFRSASVHNKVRIVLFKRNRLPLLIVLDEMIFAARNAFSGLLSRS